MRKYLANTTATYKAGISPGVKVFKVDSGPYAGRMAILMQTSGNEIYITYSDYPYTIWSTPERMISDCADYPFDAVMTPSHDIYIVYTLETSFDLVTRKLTFSVGNWHDGNLNTIYNDSAGFFPSILHEEPSRFWVSYSRQSGSQFYVCAAYSDDDCVTWGAGPLDPGFTLTGLGDSAFSKTIIFGSFLHVIYTHDGSKIAFRRKHLGSQTWNSEQEVSSGSGFDDHFDAAVAENGRLGIVFDDGQVRFRDFDGSGWSGIATIDANGGTSPQLKYFDNIPYVIYLSNYGTNQNKLVYSRRVADNFSSPILLDQQKSVFDKVYCYNSVSGTYEDLTSGASDDTSGDILHSVSSSLLKNSGDVLYCGMENKFNYLKIVQSTAGSGGGIDWQYFNGQDWSSFTPSGGGYNFDSLDKELLLWDDYGDIAGDWQKKDVSGSYYYWIRAVVSSEFSVGSVGSQITAIPNTSAILIMEQ